MPTLVNFGSFTIRMYFADHNPPHVHVEAADFRALVAISDGTVFRGAIDPKFKDQALAWIVENRGALLQKWAEFQE